MPINHDTIERCAYCLREFTAYWKDRKVLTTSVPVTSIGNGLWLCDEHKFNETQIGKLKLIIKHKLSITEKL